MDRVQLWNRALTADEVRASMRRAFTVTEDGLVGYWTFDDGTANDATTNANTGTLQGDAVIATNDVEGVNGFHGGACAGRAVCGRGRTHARPI
jgi:hypothetical protein